MENRRGAKSVSTPGNVNAWDALAARGHNVVLRERIGNAHGLTVEYDQSGMPVRFTGGADTRGTGLAGGYGADVR